MVEKKPDQIRRMFASIAHRYDLLNHLLSLSIDRWWRCVTTREVVSALDPNSLLLDLCTGTGDLALGFARHIRVVGCDFCHPMLLRGIEKSRRQGLSHRLRFVEADALHLPFPAERFQGVSVAFGLRNLEQTEKGLREMHRVLQPGGCLAILEFAVPTLPGFRHLYLFYFTRILPRIGELISGREGPYSYLPESVKEFPDPPKLERIIAQVGFSRVRHRSLTGGVAMLYLAHK